jgi:phosphoglucosamine mutase
MKFGTDGIRGSSIDFLTPDVAFNFGVAFAASRIIYRPLPTLVVARDTRISGERLEAYLVAGMRSAGANVIVTGIMPTAALSQFILDKEMDGGVMITASHNPPEDNGLKPLNHLGKKLNQEEKQNLEYLFESRITADSQTSGSSYEISSGWIPWIQKIWNFIRQSGKENSLIGEKIVVDAGNGAGRFLLGQALAPFGAKIIEIGNRDGDMINIDCGSLHPRRMAQLVASSGAIAGIALDGDGDRIQICDKWGRLYDGDDILWLLRGKSKVVIGTIMTNEGLSISLKREGVTLYRTAVGDSNVADAMLSYWSPIGGEPSGHILFEDGMPTSCGVFTAAKLLAINPSLWPQEIDNLIKTHQITSKVPIQDIDHLKEKIEELTISGLRVVVRESGTEPVIRLMVEGEVKEKVEEGLSSLLGLLGSGS